MPRKKLSTKPIRIDIPEVSSQSTSGIPDPNQKQDYVKPDSSLQESNKPEVQKQDSSKQDSSKTETLKQESSLEESTHQDSSKPDSSLQDSNQLEACRQDYSSPESNQLESSQLETSKQDFSLSESNQLESSQLETSKQDFSLSESNQLESNQLETSKQDSRSPESNQPESSLTETEYKKVAMRLSLQAAEHLRQFRSDTGIPYEILVDVMVRNWSKLPERTRNAYLKQAQQLRSQRLLAGQEKTMKTLQQKYQQHL